MTDSNATPAPKKPCCTPAAGPRNNPAGAPPIPPGRRANSTDGMVLVAKGSFFMGAEDPEIWEADGESPVREVFLDAFHIDRCCVTNREFEEFVNDTGYRTEAEVFGWSFVFRNQIPKDKLRKISFETVQGVPWWARVENADWRKPGGPGTNIRKRLDHPVVHVSWTDANAYCQWSGKRLSTEAEWECAARGGRRGNLYPWGDELEPEGKHRCNIWQGEFPAHDSAADGYDSTAPARSFPANDFGIYNVSGNVWEWVADWFSPDYHRLHSYERIENPLGPPGGTSRVIRGGSFLCHHSYCNRYRVSARTSNTPESSTCHTGFRCVRTVGC